MARCAKYGPLWQGTLEDGWYGAEVIELPHNEDVVKVRYPASASQNEYIETVVIRGELHEGG